MERTYRTNVFAMVWLCQEVHARMEPGGTIINTSSIQASQPSPALYDYATTKRPSSTSPETWLRNWRLAASG